MNTLPRLFLNLFERIDCCGDKPVILRQEDVPTADKALLRDLIRQGLLTESISQSVTCISCDSVAEIKRSGPRGIKLTAVCGECASVFSVTQGDMIEYRTGWQTTASWLAGMLSLQEPPELVYDNAYYIGNIKRDAVTREIYLSKCLVGKTAEATYTEISKFIQHDGIVISLSKLSLQPTSSRLILCPIQSLIVIQRGAAKFSTEQLFMTKTNPTKSRAARSRWDNDPLLAQKDILKANVKKKLATEFLEPMLHDQIFTAIKSKYPVWLTYTDHEGNQKNLTDRMGRSLIADTLNEAGEKHRINGKYRSK